jgi:hypothetical protein
MPDKSQNESMPKPRSGQLLFELLQEAGIGSGSVVRVAGRGGLAPLIWLCRRGFADVGYVRPGLGGPREPADVLLVLDSLSLAELDTLVHEHGLVRQGGVVIVKTPDLHDADGHDLAHDVLERAGFRVERCVPRRCQELHVARLGLAKAA